MQTFPKPLTPGEERACLERLQEGDREARDILIERNLRLVAHVAKKYQGTDYEQDDLLSVGTIGLIKAVNTFHPERGSRLATYAAKCIENEILMMFRAGKKYSREVSLFEPIGVDKDGESVSLVDVIELETKEVLEDLILDQDGNVILTEGLVLQQKVIWKRFLGKEIIEKSNSCELYFEEPDLEGFVEKLDRLYPSVQYVNRLMTHSWGQKVVRFYDLDGNLIEVGTPM